MWKLDSDEDFFRIDDSKRMVAGYFDPDYGDIYPKENAAEIIANMLKNHDKILGDVVMVPLVKFGLFDTDLDTDIFEVDNNVKRALSHLDKWKNFLAETNKNVHSVRISHTDQDMLTITFQVFKTHSFAQKRFNRRALSYFRFVAEIKFVINLPENFVIPICADKVPTRTINVPIGNSGTAANSSDSAINSYLSIS